MKKPAGEADGTAGIGNTDFYFERVLNGDAEAVRERLAGALTSLGYRVLGTHPLRAKRGARGLGTYHCSADILEYPTKLTVALKPLSQAATRATFDYEVTHAMGVATRWDKQTLRREAEAVVALADLSEGPFACATCGSGNTDDSRYCRLCGTPSGGGEPAELEVMRLTAGARAGYHLNLTGVVALLLTLLAALPLMWFGRPKAIGLGWFLLVVGGAASLASLALGTLRLRRTLNTPEGDRRQALPGGPRQVLPPTRSASLPPLPARESITEGTTDLLTPPHRKRAAVPSGRERLTTNSFD